MQIINQKLVPQKTSKVAARNVLTINQKLYNESNNDDYLRFTYVEVASFLIFFVFVNFEHLDSIERHARQRSRRIVLIRELFL